MNWDIEFSLKSKKNYRVKFEVIFSQTEQSVVKKDFRKCYQI